MNTVLLGYWLQTWLIHPLRFWFIYLTNWTLSVQCAYLTLAVYATWHAGQAAAPTAAPRYLPALLYLQGIALPGSALVTLLFWTLVLPTWPEAATYTVNYLVHGANLAVMIADCALCSQPFPLRYSFGLFPYGVVYVLFTAVYWAAGGTNEWGQPWIYIPIYWGGSGAKAGAALCVALVLLFVPGLILLCWACVRLRNAWAAGGAALQGGGAAPAEEESDAPGHGEERLGLLRRDALLHPLVEGNEEAYDAEDVFPSTPPTIPPAGELREFARAEQAPAASAAPAEAPANLL